MKRPDLVGVQLLVTISIALSCAVGCGFFDDGGGPRNLRPVVKLEAVPPVGDTTQYVVEFTWTASDPDGEIDHFLHAVDPPDDPGADTSWVSTAAHSVTVKFTVDEYDTTTIDDPYSDWKRHQIALGYHEFIVVAVDDDGAVSAPDGLFFNASTICPLTQITSPPPPTEGLMYQGAGQDVGPRVAFRWTGEDPDGVFTDEPVRYMYKLKKLGDWGVTWRTVSDSLYADPAPWVDVGGDTTVVVLDLVPETSYGFGVRAVDEAGAVEPLLILNRNLLWVRARRLQSSPSIALESSVFGRREWRGWAMDAEEYEVPLGSSYEFSFSGDADWYGGLIEGYSYGWDIKNVESDETHPEGIGAWTPWSETAPSIVAEFSDHLDRFLFVKCRDDLGGVSLATIRFNVVELQATKNLGYVDDCRMYPKDDFRGEPLDDMNWELFLRGYDYGQGWDSLAWDEWDAPHGEEVPPLEWLSQFKVIVWSLCDRREFTPDQRSAWYHMNSLNEHNTLAMYLSLRIGDGDRGKVWVFGSRMIETCSLALGGSYCGYPIPVKDDCPLLSCCIRPRTFAYDFLHIGGDFNNGNPGAGGTRINLFRDPGDEMVSVYVNPGPLPTRDCALVPAADLYPNLPPELEIDLSKPRAAAMRFCEVVEYPGPDQEVQLAFCHPGAGPTGLIPLYRYNAETDASDAHGKYCGFRYVPQAENDHGEIVYFFFPMYPMRDDQARGTALVVLSDWFGLPHPDDAP
jgi:hypothetical protein